jgi:hypothetical protein
MVCQITTQLGRCLHVNVFCHLLLSYVAVVQCLDYKLTVGGLSLAGAKERVRGRSPWYPLNRRVLAPEPVWLQIQEEKLFALLGIESDCPVCSQTLY